MGQHQPAPSATSPTLLAADSFRAEVRAGITGVRAWARHRSRFSAAVAACAPALSASLPEFFDDAAEQIAAFGNGFPRLELWGRLRAEPALAVELRPVPELGSPVHLRTTSPEEPCGRATKGPNISRFAALNRTLGGEALLRDANGHMLEGATTSLLWWQGDELGRVKDSRRVASVTEQLICEMAHEYGVPIVAASVKPDEVMRYELWAVNALHGIRAVRTIDGRTLGSPDSDRLAQFQAGLDARWEPVAPQLTR